MGRLRVCCDPSTLSNAPFQKRCLEGGSRETENNRVVLAKIVVPQTIVCGAIAE